MTNGWNPPPGGQGIGQQPQQGQAPQPQGWGQPQQGQPGQFGAQPPAGQPSAPQGFGTPQPGFAAPAPAGAFPGAFPGGMPSAAQASGLAKGFLGSLIDFKFQSYITPRILGILYGLMMLMAVLMVPMAIYQSVIRPMMDDYAFTEPEFLPAFLSPIGAFLSIVFGRVLLETIAVRFRNAEQLDELIHKTKS